MIKFKNSKWHAYIYYDYFHWLKLLKKMSKNMIGSALPKPQKILSLLHNYNLE
jgi:hypothetical protein